VFWNEQLDHRHCTCTVVYLATFTSHGEKGETFPCSQVDQYESSSSTRVRECEIGEIEIERYIEIGKWVAYVFLVR